ncbi:uncharacterized protein [Spinacia oleracea]|nr:uncharacterized protein LOC110779373 isoform X2 [Spinacia oleracea]XP_021839582.2 uncharacterized protein LOC110779373 isoform X2 [Spinacia oleracea]XP_021839583.2 uncharacterized protein LOC110779373 isoform X2 [Spinacia oleracea]XP_056696020.1 uncharacterized protein LOC110779373 isoform X2 [Spinacia oleracea]
MEPINIRLFYGGRFVTKKWKTTYEKGDSSKFGFSLHPNVGEVCYFEFVDWIKRELGFKEVGHIWFRKHGCSLFTGRKEINSDVEIPEFLQSKEKDGWYYLYVVHEEAKEIDISIDNLNSLQPNIPPSVGTHTIQTASKQTPRTKKTQSASIRYKELVPISEDILEYEAEWDSDSDDSDMCLSEGDFEDESDDDLFAANVDANISERVTRSLEVPSTDKEVDENEDVGVDIHFDSDVDLNESDDELQSLDGSDDEGPNYPVFNPQVDFRGNVKLSLGMKFPSNTVFRKALRHHAIESGHDYYYLHNGSKRITVYCAKRCACPWKTAKIVKCSCTQKRKCRFKVHCVKMKDEETFQIKSLRLVHVCGHQHENSKVTSQYLAERYLEDWREDPKKDILSFMLRVRREVKAEVGYYKCYYSRQIAMRMIFGDAASEYKRVWDYAEAIRHYNPGSTAIVKVEGIETSLVVFQRIYICLQPCKEGFMAGCRPILGVDGCHLRGSHPGVLLTAVGKDGNNNIFPVAWAVVETKNSETWVWFLELLVQDIKSVADAVTWVHENEDEDDLTYMSDRQKGLLDAFNTVVPNAEIRFCCRHIWANFKLKFSGEIYRESFWKAARASTKHHFDKYMEAIKGLNVEAFNYLNAIPTVHWSRHAFSTRSKSAMVLNNCCESFNNVLREARTRPILSLMEWIRRYVMKRCCAKREGLKKFDGFIMPSVEKMVHRGLEKVTNMRVNEADLFEFEVDDGDDTFVVNLETKECGCFRWSLMGIPCWHALACIVKRRLRYEDYVHQAYQVSTYAATYAPMFHAMPGQSQWPKTPYVEPLPPPYRKMPGRPSKRKRVKEAGENKDKQLVKRVKKMNKCSRCGGLGHYKSKCQNVPLPPSDKPKSKGGRPKSFKVGSVSITPFAATTSNVPASVPANRAPSASVPANRAPSASVSTNRVSSSTTNRASSLVKSGSKRVVKGGSESVVGSKGGGTKAVVGSKVVGSKVVDVSKCGESKGGVGSKGVACGGSRTGNPMTSLSKKTTRAKNTTRS